MVLFHPDADPFQNVAPFQSLRARDPFANAFDILQRRQFKPS
jgi:hypothetical protein